MSDAIVIRLLNPVRDGATAQWLLVDSTGSRMGGVIEGELDEAHALATGRKVIVLVPGTEVHLAEPVLPVKRGAQLEQVTRYALEENLASDIDDLHFAIGKRRGDGSTPVAVVHQEKLGLWVESLNSAGITPDALYSEADVLPTEAASVTVVIDHGLIYLQRGSRVGAALDIQPLSEALDLVFGATDDALPDAVVYLNQAEYEAQAATLDSYRDRVPGLQTRILPEGPLPLFALRAVQSGGVNLLSGKYARKKSWNKALAPWRIAAMLFGVAVALHLATSGLQMWKLARIEKQLDLQIREIVAQTLPGVQVNDTRKARQQFEAQLNSLRGAGGGAGLLSGLDALKATMEQLPDLRIDALAYRTKVFDLRVTAPNVDALARMQQLVNEQGLHAEIQSATPRENKVEGRLQVKSGA
jgi:general secretion pathway protein L